jgi:hypothetical protein
MAIKVVVTGEANITVSGTDCTVAVPVTAYDDLNTPIASTIISVSNAYAATNLLALLVGKAQTAVATWKTGLAVIETIKGKLGVLTGKTL